MEAILVSAVGAIGVVLAAMINSLRKENHSDHAIVADSLNRIENKIDGHIDSHISGDL